jgi:hypothetical protein
MLSTILLPILLYQEYERVNMVPSQTSKAVAELTTALLLYHVPPFARSFGKQVVATLCPERLNKAIMWAITILRPTSRSLISLALGYLNLLPGSPSLLALF